MLKWIVNLDNTSATRQAGSHGIIYMYTSKLFKSLKRIYFPLYTLISRMESRKWRTNEHIKKFMMIIILLVVLVGGGGGGCWWYGSVYNRAITTLAEAESGKCQEQIDWDTYIFMVFGQVDNVCNQCQEDMILRRLSDIFVFKSRRWNMIVKGWSEYWFLSSVSFVTETWFCELCFMGFVITVFWWWVFFCKRIRDVKFCIQCSYFERSHLLSLWKYTEMDLSYHCRVDLTIKGFNHFTSS